MSEEVMLAAVYYGPDDLRVEKWPVPEIKPNEALLRVVSASICGTDLRILHGAHRKFPPGTVRIPGHEVVGEIARLGDDVRGLEIGQRVFVAPNIGCGHCRQCISGNYNLCADFDAYGVTIDGAFAEYMRITTASIQQGSLIPINEDVDPAVAVLIEPLSCVLHGQDALDIKPGEIVLVIGAGPIGIIHMMLAQLHGARLVIVSELLPERLSQAKRLGAGLVVNPAKEDLAKVIFDESNGEGADVIIVAAPAHRAQEGALELAAVGGRINFFGGLPKDSPSITFDSNLVHYKELIITGTTGSNTKDCQRAAVIVCSGSIDLSGIVSVRYPLYRAREAFAAAEDRQTLKVVIEPDKSLHRSEI